MAQSFTPIGDTLLTSTKGPLKKQLEVSEVVELSQRVFGEFFGEQAVHTKALYLKNRTLTVTCSSPAMAQEIRLNQAKIVEKINADLGKSEVDRIRYLA